MSFLLSILKSKNRTANISRQVIYLFILKGVNILVGLLYVPLLLNYLDKERYGVWLTVITIINWFSIFDIGLGNGLRNKLTQAIALKDIGLCRTYISTTYALLIIIFVSILTIFLVVNPYINWSAILNTTIISRYELFLLTSVVFSCFFVRFIVQLIGVIYLSLQRPIINSLILTIGSIISLLMVLFLSKCSTGSVVVLGCIVSLIPVLLYIVLTFITFKYIYPFLLPSFRFVDFKYSRDLLLLGGRFFVVQTTSLAIFSSSNMLISQLFSPADVSSYSIALTYFNIPIMIYGIVLSPIWSAVTEAYAVSDFVWLKVTLKRLNILSVVFVFFIVLMLFLSPFFFRIWIGDSIQIPFTTSLIMAFYAVVNIILAPYSNFINGLGKIKLTSMLSFVGISIFFLFSFLFAYIFKNSFAIPLALSLASIVGLTIQPLQTYLILSNRAKGVWNK